jgi:D-3-phosphoglycerate dehydrogenase
MSFTVAVTDYTFPSFGPYEAVLGRIGATLAVPAEPTLEAFLAIAGEADAVLHEHLELSGPVVSRLARCRVISHHGKGVDNIDVAGATKLGIVVANVLDASLYEVAEHVFALTLAVARRLCVYDAAVRGGTWDVRSGEPVYRLHGKTLGLIGFGRIAQQVASTARAFGMRVIAYARHTDATLGDALGVRFAPAIEVFASADVVSLHLPLTDETRCIAGARELRAMKLSAILVNVSRGGLVDEDALRSALDDGRIFGAGLDVLTVEPPQAGHALAAHPRVVVTPHCAWYSEEGRMDVETRTAQAAVAVLTGSAPESWVNPEAKANFEARFGALRPSV